MPSYQSAVTATALAKQLKWQRDPLSYFQERLNVPRETIDWGLLPEYKSHKWDGDERPYKRLLDAIVSWRWVAVESGVSVGKTFLGACLLLYFLENFKGGRVVTIAPKQDQLELHIWAEVNKLYPRFARGELQTLKLRMEPGNDLWAAHGFVAGVSASEAAMSATKAQGFHSENQLIIFEETPGIHEAVMAAFENTATAPHNILVAFGNPNSQTDTLHRFGSRQDVELIRISGFDHPNVVLKNPMFIPGAQTEQGLERLLTKYRREDHPMYLSRAKGISPMQGVDSLIRWEWCLAAMQRGTGIEGPWALGVDVANSEEGDKAAIARGHGTALEEVLSFPCPNSNMLGGDVRRLMGQYGIRQEFVGVDSVGVGAGTVNELKRLGAQIQKLGGGDKPVDRWEAGGIKLEERFVNLRSQMWWQMAEDLQNGEQTRVVLPDDEELFVDLTTPRFATNKKGLIEVESKDMLKKRLGRSPDKGDACVYWNWVRSRRMGVAATASGDENGAEDDPYKAERRRAW